MYFGSDYYEVLAKLKAYINQLFKQTTIEWTYLNQAIQVILSMLRGGLVICCS